MSHSKTPFTLKRTRSLYPMIFDSDGEVIGYLTAMSERDQKFIVRACNSHDDLVKALDKLIQWYGKREKDDPDDELLPAELQFEEIQLAMRVLEKAKE